MRGSDHFFHSRIDQMINLRHPLAVLASDASRVKVVGP